MDVKIGVSFLHEIFFTNEQYAYRTIYLYFIKHVNEFFILTRKQHKNHKNLVVEFSQDSSIPRTAAPSTVRFARYIFLTFESYKTKQGLFYPAIKTLWKYLKDEPTNYEGLMK